MERSQSAFNDACPDKSFQSFVKGGNEDFAAYYIVGYTIWAFFSESTITSLDSIIGASSLIKKVYIPKYVFPLEKCLFSAVNMCFSMIATLAVVIYRSIVTHTMMLSFYSFMFPLPIIYTFIFVCGMALFLSAVTVYFRDVAHLYTVLLTMWMYLTPIIYPVKLLEGDDIKHTLIRTVVWLNPLTHYVEMFRNILIRQCPSTLQDHLICIGISLLSLLIGSLVFNKAQSKFILHI